MEGGEALSMIKHQHVLAVGFGPDFDPLAGRLLLLGFRAVRVSSTEEAMRALERAGEPIQGAMLCVPHRLGDLGFAVSRMRERAPSRALRLVAVGPRPSPPELEELRKAGVEFALWQPFDDAALRFVLNQAIHQVGESEGRRKLRAPTTMVARIFSQAGQKAALVYNLSESGAYLETHRPTGASGHIRVELPLPSGTVTLDARVVSTNVPGNVSRSNLPMGMGVQFVNVPDDVCQKLAEHVEALAAAFRIDSHERD
jgi:hypothetical protein